MLIVEDSNHASTGTYSLYLTKLNPPPSTIPIQYGEYITGYCNDTAELIPYSFTAQSGDAIRIYKTSSYADIFLYSPSGVKIPISDPTVLSNSGNYTIAVALTPGASPSSFTFYIDSVNRPSSVTSLTYGQTVNGSLATPIDSKIFSFSGTAGDLIDARLLTTTIRDPRLSLWKSDGTWLASVDFYWYYNQYFIDYRLPDDGIYVLIIEDYYHASTGNYSLSLTKLNPPPTTIPIQYGAYITGNCNDTAELIPYSFSAQSGDAIRIYLASSCADVFLYSPSGSQINIANPTFFNAPGNYTVAISLRPSAQPGPYTFYIDCVNRPSTNSFISYDQVIEASITKPIDVYLFNATAGDEVLARISSTASSRGPLCMYKMDGTLVANENGYPSWNEIGYHVLESGTYAIAVDNLDASTGTYSLYLTKLNPPPTVTPISYGQVISGNFTRSEEMISYSFHAQPGDSIRIWMNSPCSEVRLYSPSGARISIIDPTILSVGGTYYITPTLNPGYNSGTYSIYIESVNRPSGAILISYDQVIPANVSNPIGMDVYTFNATAGDQILTRVSTSWQNAHMGLYKIDGTQITSGYSWYSGEIEYHVLESGTYAIAVDNWDTVNDTYSLYLTKLNPPPTVTPILYGQVISGNFTRPEEMIPYSFHVQPGDSIRVWMNSPCSEVRLYSSSGARISITDPTILSIGGTYYLIPTINPGYNSGSYSFYIESVNRPSGATPISYNQLVNATTSNPIGMDVYTFNATAGDQVLGRISTSWQNAHLSMYKMDGTQIANQYTWWYSSEIGYHILESGTYAIAVDNWDNVNDTYYLYLQRTNSPINATPIIFGVTIPVNLTIQAEPKLFTFSGLDGDQISISSDAPDIRIYSPLGYLLAQGTTQLSQTLTSTGTYTLIVDGSPGNYSATLNGIHPTKLLIGQSYQNSISSSAWTPWNYYYSNVPANKDLLIQVIPSSPSDQLELYCSLTQIPSESVTDYIQKDKSVNGTYDLLISPTIASTYYFGVKAIPGSSNYTIKTSMGGKYISDIHPHNVSRSSSAAISLYGLGYTSGMQVYLLKNTTHVADSQQLIYSSPTMLIATFDLSSIPVDAYDVGVKWSDGEEVILSSILNVNPLPEGALYQDKNCKVKSGIPVNYSISISGKQNLFVTLNKIQYPGDSHYNWMGTLSILKNDTPIKSDSGDQDQILQLVNPDDGVYTISVIPQSDGTGILTIWDSLPELPDGNWVVTPIYRPYGSDFHQFTVAPGRNTFTLNAEAMGMWSRFHVFRNYWGSGEQWISSQGPDASLSIPNPKSGLYVLEFLDTQMITGDEQARDVMLKAATSVSSDIPPVYRPTISGITPTRGGNVGTVTMEITGAWLESNATISLNQGGVPSISAQSVYGSSDNRKLIATFDLTGTTAGSYTLNVTNSDGTSVSASTPFSIIDGGRSEFWTKITGREKIRVGRPSTYIIQYGNNGTVDMPAPLKKLTSDSSSANVEVQFNVSSPWIPMNNGGKVEPIIFRADGPGEIPTVLPAGSSYKKEIQVKADDLSEFSLIVTPYSDCQLYTPDTIDTVIDTTTPAPGTPLAVVRLFPIAYSSNLGSLGYGWKFSYEMSLREFADGLYGLMNGDNPIMVFYPQNNDIYISKSGNSILKKNVTVQCDR